MLLIAVLLGPSPASAWVETSVRSHSATIEVERSGSAIVSQEFLIKVKGGPLKSFSIGGVEKSAQLLDTATVSPLSGSPQEKIPLLLHLGEDGELRMEIGGDRPVRRGVYLFTFSYRDNLAARGLLKRRGDSVKVTWVGPRVEHGIDSAKVTFRLPKSRRAPGVWSDPSDDSPADFSLGGGGVLLSQLRRTATLDEIELVKAHVAKGEPAVWQVSASPEAFMPKTVLPDSAGTPSAPSTSAGAKAQRPVGSLLAWAVGLALLYALLVAFKWHATDTYYRRHGAEARAVIGMPFAWRSALAGLAIGGALLAFLLGRDFTLSSCLLGTAMLLATQKAPAFSLVARGPGQWKTCTKSALTSVRNVPLPVRLLDPSSLVGFAGMLLLGVGVGVLAAWQAPVEPYAAVAIVLAGVACLPLFMTGRARAVLPDGVQEPRRLFARVARTLERIDGISSTVLARYPLGREEPDELRLSLEAAELPRGMRTIEVAAEYDLGAAGPVLRPCLVLRVTDDSPAYHKLGQRVIWSRGRDRDERVCILRPALPTRAQVLELTRSLVAALRDHEMPAAISRDMSSATGKVTRKGGSNSQQAA